MKSSLNFENSFLTTITFRMPTQAMLMAAGFGTRMKPFSDLSVKSLLPVMGIPLLQYALRSLDAAGVNRYVMNLHHLAADAKSGASLLEPRLLFSDESREILGSGGALRHAAPLFEPGKPFFYVNPDVLCDIDWNALSERHHMLRKKNGVNLTLALSLKSSVRGKYREIFYDLGSGLITGLGELREACPFFISAAVIEPEALDWLPQEGPADFVQSVLVPAVTAKKAGFQLLSDVIWYDIGSAELWMKTHLALIQRLETSHFPSNRSSDWKREIEKHNVKIAPRVWASRRSIKKAQSVGSMTGPIYLDSDQHYSIKSRLGPQLVLYDSQSDESPTVDVYSNAIRFRGKTFQSDQCD
jgi:NDP-sugar pyrophosphorylase family protein